MTSDVWAVGDAYENYVGRWSRLVAAQFLARLEVPAGSAWLDVGCGTGALTAAVLAAAQPAEVIGVDPSQGFLDTARARVADGRASFQVGDAQALPLPDNRFDAVVSGLALNFVPDPARAAAECVRVGRPGAVVAAYVWDYLEGMQMMIRFWAAAAALDPAVAELDEARRFALCRPELLRDLWQAAGLTEVSTGAIEVPTVFAGFADFWSPFLGGQGPGPAYVMSLTEDRREALRARLQDTLPSEVDGTIRLTASALVIVGTVRRLTDSE